MQTIKNCGLSLPRVQKWCLVLGIVVFDVVPLGICFKGDYGLIGSRELVQHDSVLIEWPVGWNCNLPWLFVFLKEFWPIAACCVFGCSLDDCLSRAAIWLGTIGCRATWASLTYGQIGKLDDLNVSQTRNQVCPALRQLVVFEDLAALETAKEVAERTQQFALAEAIDRELVAKWLEGPTTDETHPETQGEPQHFRFWMPWLKNHKSLRYTVYPFPGQSNSPSRLYFAEKGDIAPVGGAISQDRPMTWTTTRPSSVQPKMEVSAHRSHTRCWRTVQNSWPDTGQPLKSIETYRNPLHSAEI